MLDDEMVTELTGALERLGDDCDDADLEAELGWNAEVLERVSRLAAQRGIIARRCECGADHVYLPEEEIRELLGALIALGGGSTEDVATQLGWSADYTAAALETAARHGLVNNLN